MGKKSRRQRVRAKTSNTTRSGTVGETQYKGEPVWPGYKGKPVWPVNYIPPVADPMEDTRTTSSRAKANLLRSRLVVLMKLPDHWHEQRLNGFAAFLDAIYPFAYFRQFPIHDSDLWEDDIKQDMHLLKRIRRSSREPIFYRAKACFFMAQYKFRLNDPYGESLKWFDSAYDMYNSASDEERSLRVRMGGTFVSCGDYYDEMRDKVFDFVRYISDLYHLRRWARNFDGSEPVLEHVGVSHYAGWTCDYCEKPRDCVPGGYLLKCSVCCLVYYCSRECQKKDWNIRGHKKQCRAKGQFREFDTVALTTDVESYEPGGDCRPQERGFSAHQYVVLGPPRAEGAEPTPATAAHFIFDKENPVKKFGFVEKHYLKRVRSPLWTALGEQDLQEIGKNLDSKDLRGGETHVDSNDEESLPNLLRSNTILDDIESDDDGSDGEEVEKQLETESN